MNLPERHALRPPPGLDEHDLILFAEHCNAGRFFNPWNPTPQPGPREILRWKLGTNPYAEAKRNEAPLEAVAGGLEQLSATGGQGIVWIGHASFLVELDGLRILIDPIFGSASPVVPRRAGLPFDVDALPPIDVILITHGHYDHLDRPTLTRLGERFGEQAMVIVPLGLGSVVPRNLPRVVELDWWDVVDFGGVDAVFVPAQHWHRRGLADYNRALWGGWVLRGSRTHYHSGDSGYFRGFRTLGRIFEGIDVAMMPVGAYEPRWFMSPQHMGPDESLRAFDELGAAHFLGMHWGTFDLTDEPLREGAAELERLVREQHRDPSRFHLLAPGECLPRF